jgi:hypothetical protein
MATTNATTSEIFRLRKNETLRLPYGIEVALRVERGTVLVTQEGDREDHVLEHGDELLVPAGGLAVAWAFTEARVSIRAAERGCLAA